MNKEVIIDIENPKDNDLVSREAVLKAVSEGCQEWRGVYGRCEELINALPSVNPQPSEHFIDGVHAMGYREGYKDAQKQKSGKWIPVSERLPEYTINDKVSENVLVFDGTDIRIGEYRKGIHVHGAGYWRVFGYEIDEYVDVIAWMPLPKPYEPQERSDKE